MSDYQTCEHCRGTGYCDPDYDRECPVCLGTGETLIDRPTKYVAVIMPFGRSANGVHADITRNPMFAGASVHLVAREGDDVSGLSFTPASVTRVNKVGRMLDLDLVRLIRAVQDADGDDRVALVANGGTTPQTWAIAALYLLNGGAFMDAFDVQRDGIVHMKPLGNGFPDTRERYWWETDKSSL